MAAPNDPTGFPFDEDEDLFDFPIIEMTLEGLQERSSSETQSRPMTVEPMPPPALPKQAPKPTPAPTMSTAPSSAAPSSPAPSAPIPDPRPAPVSLVTPLATIPPDEDEVAGKSLAPVSRGSRLRGMRVVLVFLIAMNAGGFWFLWRTHSTFGAGLQDLRAEIDTASKRLERARRDVNDRATPLMADGSPALEAIDALERTAIQLATDEIRAGDYSGARRRLSRLLARAERMSPGLRAEVEPRAAYLVAQSYHDEARARNGAKQ